MSDCTQPLASNWMHILDPNIRIAYSHRYVS